MRIDRMLSRFWFCGLLLTVLWSGCGNKTRINQTAPTSAETFIQVYDLLKPQQAHQYQKRSELHTPVQIGQITLDKTVSESSNEVRVEDLHQYKDWTPFRAELQDQAIAMGGDTLLINRVDPYSIPLDRHGRPEIATPGNALTGRMDEQRSEVQVDASRGTLVRVKIEATVIRWTD